MITGLDIIVSIFVALLFYQLFDRTKMLEEDVRKLKDQIGKSDLSQNNNSPAEPNIVASVIPQYSPAFETQTTDKNPEQKAAPADILQPSLFEKYLEKYFTGGRALVSTGIIIIFFGVAFLLKYASSIIEISIGSRFVGVAVAAFAMIAVGWRFVEKRRIFGLALQGGGIGILFLSTFIAFRFYNLINPTLAFGLLISLGALSAFLAIKNDVKELAILAAIGGFLAPILASTGSANHIGLFSYYLLLNVVILVIAWFKAWRLLNLVGFGFTFVISTLWGAKFYSLNYFASTEPFLITFFLLYVVVAILFSTRQMPDFKGYIDGTIVFGVPLVGFALQISLVKEFENGSAISALVIGAFYSVLWYVLHPQNNKGFQIISKAFLALGLIFLTLAIPLAFDGRHTSGLWALEGAAIIWINMRQKNLFYRSLGAALQFGAGLFFIAAHPYQGQVTPILNSGYIGCVIISLSGLFSAYLYVHYKEITHRFEKYNSTILGLWGMVWWFCGGIDQIIDFVPYQFKIMSMLGFIALSTLVMEIIGNKYQAEFLRKPINFLLAVMIIAWFMQLGNAHPFINGGILAWPAAFVAQYYMLYNRNDEKLCWYHAASLWLIIILLAQGASYFISLNIGNSQSLICLSWFIIPALAILFISRKTEISPWPFNDHRQTYIGIGSVPIICFLGALFFYSAIELDGNTYPIPYIPLLNFLDVAHLIAILSVGKYIMHLRNEPPKWLDEGNLKRLISYFAIFLFIWINAALLRAIHHLTGIAYSSTSLFNSELVQTSITILWTLIATGIMIFSSKKYMRVVWFAGAALLGVVVIKLFIIDLSGTGTLARIFSFIVVGSLILILGYFSPAPPNNTLCTPK